MDIEQARLNMIEQQIRPWNVSDVGVLKIIAETPRERFVPDRHQKLAFADMEIPLGHGQFMMTPKVEARMLQALQINPDDNILEIGTGSGFITACLAKLGKHVDTIERHADFSDRAQSVLKRLAINNVNYIQGDALSDSNDAGRYDAVVVSASMPVYLDEFEDRLAENGRMFVVTGQAPVMQAQLVSRKNEEGVSHTRLFETCLRPLVGIQAPQTFQL